MSEVKELVQSIVNESDNVVYEDVLNEISNLRRDESSAKDYSRTLKFNYVECKSKEVFLNMLKSELDVSKLGIEFPSEDDLQLSKKLARDLQNDNQTLESKILKQIDQLKEYKSMLNRLNSGDTTDIILDENNESSGNISPQLEKYKSMISWYTSVIKSIQVLSGISINEYKQDKDSLHLLITLKFSKKGISPHTLDIIFDGNTEKLVNAKVSILFPFLSLFIIYSFTI